MSISIEQAAEAVTKALTDQAKDFVNTQGDAWQKFAKVYGKDLAEQAWIVKTGRNEDAKNQARENINWMYLDAEAMISTAGLALVGEHSGAILKHLMGLAGKMALGLLL